jgi:RHS repeat-associated protein
VFNIVRSTAARARRLLPLFAIQIVTMSSPLTAQPPLIFTRVVDVSYGDDVLWDGREFFKVRLSLAVQNTSTTTQTAWAWVDDCGPFQFPNNDGCPGVANAPSVAPGQTGILFIDLKYQGTDGLVRVIVTPGGGATDTAVVRLNDLTGVATLLAATYTPQAGPKGASATLGAFNSSAAVGFNVYNAGTARGTFKLKALCGAWTSTCSLWDSTITLAAGVSAMVNVTTRTSGVGTGGLVRLVVTAPPQRSGVVQVDTGSITTVVSDLVSPTIEFVAAGTADADHWTYARSVQTTIDVCDQDGSLSTPTLRFNGVVIVAATLETPSRPGCNSSKRATYTVNLPLSTTANAVDIVASDGVHTVTRSESVIYDDALDHTPSTTATHSTIAAPPNRQVIDTFRVTNRGWHSVTYGLAASCTHSDYAGCQAGLTMSSIQVAAGATVLVPVSFFTARTSGQTATVSLRASYAGLHDTFASADSMRATSALIVAPTISLTPASGSVVTTNRITLTAVWCDADGALASHVVAWQGQSLPDTYVVESRAGCVTAGRSTWTNLAIDPWQQLAVATATDAEGHVTTASTTITYDLPIITFRPVVTPKSGWHVFPRGVAVSDTFVVRNAGQYNASFALTASCGALGACTATPASVVLAPGAVSTAIVRFTSPAVVGAGDTVRLIARYTNPAGTTVADTGRKFGVVPAVEAAPIVVAMTPAIDLLQASYKTSRSFRITNPGSAQAVYSLSSVLTGGFRLQGDMPNPDTLVAVSPGETVDVSISIEAPGAAGVAGTYSRTATYVTTSGVTLTGTDAHQIVTSGAAAFLISVSPSNLTRSLFPGVVGQETFSILNVGSSKAVFDYSVACATPSVVSCAGTTASTDSVPVGASRIVVVNYAVVGVPGSLGNVALDVRARGTPSASARGIVSIAVRSSAALTVNVESANPGTALSRGQCLTIAAGDDAAFECGALRVVHPLPSTRTMNRDWTPALIYNSQHATATVLLAADVTVDAGTCFTQITARVRFAERDTSRSVPWPACSAGVDVRRVVVAIDGRGLSGGTGLYPYTFEVTGVKGDGTTVSAMASGTTVMIDRSGSPFGKGWWLDGLEQLAVVQGNSNQLLWLGGDGSSRLYTRALATDSIWLVQPALDRVDTLERRSSNEYRRHLRNGAYVQFDGALRHVATVNEHGHVTRFVRLTGTTVDTIGLPTPVGSPAARTYALVYTNGSLDSVIAPAGAQPRATRIIRSIGNVSIRDPDFNAVSYQVDAVGRIVARVNRHRDTTTFDYDGQTVSRVARRMGGDLPIVTAFCAAEATSLASCAPDLRAPTSVVTRVNGPRTDTTVAQFQLTRYGAPWRVVGALNDTTTIERTDIHFPLLVTAVVDAVGHRVEAAYSARALDSVITNRNPLGNGQSATTRYTWHSALDKPIEVAQPNGVVQTMTYDTSTGNLLWQQIGSSAERRAVFGYDPATGLVARVTPPAPLGPTQYHYDALGNIDRVTSAKGFTTSTMHDALGRDSLILTPIDTMQTLFRSRALLYDLMDRVVSSTDSTPAVGVIGSMPLALHMTTAYDEEGHPSAIRRWSSPDTAHVGEIVSDYDYDLAGRRITERDRFASADQATRWRYDAAGNVVAHTGRDQRAVIMRYDAGDRMTERRIPSVANRYGSTEDVQTFAYDKMGRVLMAANAFARVDRSYAPAGWLVTDTIRVRAADLTVGLWAHVYGMTNIYDVAGRRLEQQQPDNVTGPAFAKVAYGYDAETGVLGTVSTGASNSYAYSYNAAGLLARLTMPGNVVETHEYDVDGRELHRAEQGPQGTIHDEWFTYDAQGRRLGAAAMQTAAGVDETGLFRYNGLGAVLTSFLDVADIESIRTTVDAFGHIITKHQDGNETSPGFKSYRSDYDIHSNRLATVTGTLASGATDLLRHSYDAAGSLITQSYTQSTPFQFGEGASLPSHVDAAWVLNNTYDALGQLVVAERVTVNDNHTWSNDFTHARTAAARNAGHGSYEEYRYDALGRRIWKRTHRKPYCTAEADLETTECLSAIQITIWDGDQIAHEIRAPGQDELSAQQLESGIDNALSSTLPTQHFGRVTYLHGLGIDRPLAVMREGTVLVLHTSWRGLVDMSTDLGGRYSTCGYPGATPQTGCVDVKWPGQEVGLTFTRPYTQRGPRSWYGDVSQGNADASGQIYMRNRYYDPVTGRFTQEDPIGLGGGMNLYGFADGDPVNYTDPFGLCTRSDGWRDCDRMINGAQGQEIAYNAKGALEWTYSQGKAGDPRLTHQWRGGDCTDFVRFYVRASLGADWKSQYKASTRMFHTGDHPGFTEVESSMAQPGDVLVEGGHAGIFIGTDRGVVMGMANNGRPSNSRRGYKDGETTPRPFNRGFFGPGGPHFYRPILPR